MSMLELINATRRYQGDTVVNRVSLRVERGETLVLFGPSGAGKTVLLRMIAGVVSCDEGQVKINGHDMAQVEAEDRGVGMAFQNFALFPHMSAYDNIASPLTIGRLSHEQIDSGVQKVARLLKIDHVLTHRPRELSNGQKQRTALARALAGSPPLLLLDDPLRNVDAKLRFEMRLELPQLLAEQDATVIYVTQDYKEAMALGDRIAVIEEGRLQQLGPPESIYLAPETINIARLFGDPAINLFDVKGMRDERGLFVSLSAQKLYLPQTHDACHDRAAVLGIRPESLRFVSPSHKDAIPVTIEAETPLNEKIISLAITDGGREILISRPAGTSAPTSGAAHVAINTGTLLLFDKQSGRLIGGNATATVSDEVAA